MNTANGIIDNNVVDKIAKLSKLELSVQEKEKMVAQIEQFLEYVQLLGEIDSDIEPLENLTGNINCWREDKVVVFEKSKEIVENGPNNRNGFFLVPKVLE